MKLLNHTSYKDLFLRRTKICGNKRIMFCTIPSTVSRFLGKGYVYSEKSQRFRKEKWKLRL